jgi:hypothetical protein
MKVLGWTLLVLYSIKLIGLPFMIGKPMNWSETDFWITVISAALFIPIAGRCIGWW